jgi:predicted DNA-binding WGR domain protein
MNTYLEYQDEKSDKFWQIETRGKSFTVNFGKRGTKGQMQTKEFGSAEDCLKEAGKLVAEKLKKGYTEVGRTTRSDDVLAGPGDADDQISTMNMSGMWILSSISPIMKSSWIMSWI